MFIIRHLKLRWKLLAMIMPLVLIPLIVVTIIIGSVAIRQIYQSVTKANQADLEHMSIFTLDLLDGYYQQLDLHEREWQRERQLKLRDLTELASRLVDGQYRQYLDGRVSEEQALNAAYQGLKKVGVGESGYIYVMNSAGDLIVHIDREGDNIIDAQDEKGRLFIREICDKAPRSTPGETLYITYPWRNEAGVSAARDKVVAYRYFAPWDWIIAAGSYVDERLSSPPFSGDAFADLRRRITGKPADRPGRIYAMDCSATLVLHADQEGENVYQNFDDHGRELISRLCRGEEETSWLHYQPEVSQARGRTRVLARMTYFRPWNWIVVVETAETELVRPAKAITGRILLVMVFMLLVGGGSAAMLAFLAAKLFTEPIQTMTSAMRRVKSGHLEERLPVTVDDELGEMAAAFNHMSEMLKRDLELEEKLTRQQKMASLGVFSAEVAHEINNPMGIILGYACHLETKMDPADPRAHFVQEIKRESKRCVGIVRDLLNYAKPPEPTFQATDLDHFVDQILDFAGGHKDLKNISFRKECASGLPEVMIDRDQLRQVVMNLVLNAAAAMEAGGEIVVSLSQRGDNQVMMAFSDSGSGVAPEDLEKIFEPFFSTRKQGTGLGLAISKQIIEAHLGAIEVSSIPGRGTTVRVFLPVTQEGYDHE